MTPDPQIFNWPVRIYYEDTDVSGVVYHANYLRYFERARTEWLRAKGLSQEILRVDHGIAFTVANMEIDFLAPARLDDQLNVTVEQTSCKRASLIFSQTLRRADVPEKVLARATARVGCVDVLNFRPRALPEGLF
ncbi:MAG: tol-pal system-associated acyl-CoA thioesterase [Rhizobium sp.]|nr:MAG: tol-pal system-associated acyl-CoA thioesterase [Rhizobium sp.]